MTTLRVTWLLAVCLMGIKQSGLTQTNSLLPLPATNAVPAGPLASKIRFAETEFDFGRIQNGSVVKHTFVFTNAGDATLEITDVQPSCGCTTAGTWDKQVALGRTGSISLQFNSSGFQGEIRKGVNIVCNDPTQSNLTLLLKATIWNPVDLTPSTVMFNVSPDAQSRETRTVRILNNLEKPIELSGLQCTNRAFETELKTLRPGREFELIVTASPPYDSPRSSPLFGAITLKTSAAEVPSLFVPAYLMIRQVLTVSPDPIRIPDGPLSGAMSITVSVRNSETNALVLSDASINFPGATVRVQEQQPGRVFSLMVTLPAGFEVKPERKVELSVKSSHPRYPLIKVPVLGPAPTRLPPAIGR